MLTRLFVDNYRCFEKFTFEPKPLQLVLGANGTGKSSMFDVLEAVRVAAIEGRPVNELFGYPSSNRWSTRRMQVVEIDASLNGTKYRYHLTLEEVDSEPSVTAERLTANDRPLLKIESGNVQLFDDAGVQGNSYRQLPERCHLGSVAPEPADRRLIEFREWFSNLHVLRVEPTRMQLGTSKGERRPKPDMSDYISWYRHLAFYEPRLTGNLQERLKSVLPGFRSLVITDVGIDRSILKAEFRKAPDSAASGGQFYEFHELSDGQRALVMLYTLLEFSITTGRTLCIDEPDNFVTLRELQPWINEVIERTEDLGAQVMIISHHPELIDLLAKEHGAVFVRDGQAPPRVVPYRSTTEGVLSPSEELARGWEHG